MVLLLVFMQLTRDLFAIAKFLFSMSQFVSVTRDSIIIIIIIKNEKIRVTLCENAAGALYIVNSCLWHGHSGMALRCSRLWCYNNIR